MIDDQQLSPERSREEVHLPNRGHGRHRVRANQMPPLSPRRRKRCRAEARLFVLFAQVIQNIQLILNANEHRDLSYAEISTH